MINQFLQTKNGLYNLRRVEKIALGESEDAQSIVLKRGGSSLPSVTLKYDTETKLSHDLRLIMSGIKNGENLIILEYG